MSDHCHCLGDPVLGDELLAKNVWNGVASKVGTQDGSGDGSTACVVASSRKDSQKSFGNFVGGLNHGEECGW